MFTIANVAQPETLDEAYQILTHRRNNIIVGGCAFLRMGSMAIGTAVDLTKLSLQYIKEETDIIEIGASTTLRDIEIHPVFQSSFGGSVSRAVQNIIGVQFRNVATAGASVFSKYGFSDLLTVLTVLDTRVDLYKDGVMPLEQFLAKPYEKDILVRIFVKKDGRKAAYQSLRHSASDFPILNAAASKLGTTWKIAVGARPSAAALAVQASEFLSQNGADEKTIQQAADIAATELAFGFNLRGTAEYRRAMCRVLVKRVLTEVLSCKSN